MPGHASHLDLKPSVREMEFEGFTLLVESERERRDILES